MMALRALIFDCDGVLFESRQANLAYYNTVFSALGEPTVRPEDGNLAQICHTACSRDVFAQLLGEEKVEKALNCAEQLDYRQFIPYMEPEPGMVEVLTELSRKFPLALATNRGSSAQAILKHFGLEDLFRVVLTSLDVARPKPHPDMLLLALQRLGLTAREVLYIGDSSLDSRAAGEAQIPFVAYKWDGKGGHTVNSFAELHAWVAAISSAA